MCLLRVGSLALLPLSEQNVSHLGNGNDPALPSHWDAGLLGRGSVCPEVLSPMCGATLSCCERPEVCGVAEREFQRRVKAGSLLRHCTFSDKTWLRVCDGADVIRELAGSRETQTYCQELLLLSLRLGLTAIALSRLHARDSPAAQSASIFVSHARLPCPVSPAVCRIQSPHTCQWVVSCPRMRPWPA